MGKALEQGYHICPPMIIFPLATQEKVTKMMSVVGNIQERIPALERSHREMQQSLEHITKTLQELNRKIAA